MNMRHNQQQLRAYPWGTAAYFDANTCTGTAWEVESFAGNSRSVDISGKAPASTTMERGRMDSRSEATDSVE